MIKEFAGFLKEFNVIALAIGFVLGTSSTSLVNSLVKDIIMPILSPLMASDAWRDATLSVGPITLAYGSFLAELINFTILALIIFIVVKKLLKMNPPIKK